MSHTCTVSELVERRVEQAIAAGADYVVIGRQVTRTADPRGEFQKILEEVSGVARPA
jgi:orotidine-5'-phosphate decarboxylase